MKRTKLILSGSSLIAVALLASGCATTPALEQALVCPQCKEVTIQQLPERYDPQDGLSRTYWEFNKTRTEHSCPGCQGSLVTLFKEGKLQHKCSLCEQSPFSCPLSHP